MKANLSLRQVLLAHFQLYTVAYFQGTCFFLLGSLGMFVTTFKDMTRANMAAISNWQLWSMIIGCLVPGIATVSAFLSTTMAEKKAEKEKIDAKAERENPNPTP